MSANSWVDFLEEFSEHKRMMDDFMAAIAHIHKDYLDSVNEQDYTTMGLAISVHKDQVRYDHMSYIDVRAITL